MSKVWKMIVPPEPDESVIAVKDCDGDVWRRRGDGWQVWRGAITPWADIVRDVGSLEDATVYPEPQTWDIPPEPGPEVTHVRSANGTTRRRRSTPGATWVWVDTNDRKMSGVGVSWGTFYRHATLPLTDVSREYR